MATTEFPSCRLTGGPMLPVFPSPRRRRLRRAALAAALIGLAGSILVALHQPLLAGYARLFRVDDPAPCDALVVLLGGLDHRPAHAAELFRRGLAPTVLVAGPAATDPNIPGEARLTVQALLGHGVPRSAILVLPGQVASTRDEAELVRGHAQAHHLRRITIVTTAFHTARARWIFQKVLRGTGLETHVAAADHPAFNEANWFRSDEGLLSYLNETLKAVYYRLAY